MNKKNEEKIKDTDSKGKSDLIGDLLLTGGWSSFNKEWRNSKSGLHTTMLFLIPIVGTIILIILGIAAANLFG